ncbi:MAG: leucine--tRNA ligase [Candidatus Diapherotrites archaeon]|nr:leucine--tRNA ligase [Candidatus Diapherotrites archaeon]
MDFKSIEAKWQEEWEKAKINEAEPNDKDKYYLIFAYPGISGYLHVGHMRGYSYSDIITRYKRMRNFNVLFPAGFHATGIHAVAIANKIKNGDKEMIQYFKDNGLDEKTIESFKDYRNVLNYFYDVYANEYWKKFGFLIDWRRLTSTLHPGYQKFIQWQFRKLMQKNLLVQKPYYGAFCPNCGPVAVDPSETDIKKGGNAEKLEFTLLKFKFGDSYLIAATLRPETVYGQTNMWANPEVTYVKIAIGDEKWIVSKECAENLKYQGRDVKVLEEIPGKDLVGKTCLAPGIEREIPILPSYFPDPAVGSGLVTSVPSDAPYDYIALEDLKKDEELMRRFGLDPERVRAIKLIPIIKSKGYDEFPAKEIVERMGITSQHDVEKLEQATQEIYKVGFHTGIMRENCGKYAGMRVEEAKDAVKKDLIEQGKADTMYTFSEPVICRCGRNVVIKLIPNQWFIKYSDPDLTEKAKQWVPEMTIIPEEYKEQLPSILDWFDDRACVRQGSWLGTPFPFDEKWIIEPIADSTLYPAYYIVSKYENEGKIKPEEMTEEFFDYVFLGIGEPKNETWKQIKEDFDYWYPLDINLGGKEHKTVHFPVFIMNHVAILPGTKWPRGIFVNWWVMGKAGKMSKKGGAEPVTKAIEKYSVDAMRLYYSHVASPHQDIFWDENIVLKYKDALRRNYMLAESLIKLSGEKQYIDQWLLYNMNKHIEKATDAMESYDIRTASDEIFYGIARDLQWYKRRGGKHKETIAKVLSAWIKMMCPFTPHIAEEMWHTILKNGTLVSTENWPEPFEEEFDKSLDVAEKLVSDVLSDIRAIEKLVKKKPTKACIYTCAEWKAKALQKIISQETFDFSTIMKTLASDPELKQYVKQLPGFVKELGRKFIQYKAAKPINEYEILSSATDFFKNELGYDISVYKETDPNKYDPSNKSAKAMPLKPAIYLE